MNCYAITHTTKYEYSEPAPVCHNIVHLKPRSTAAQSCKEFQLLIDPKPAGMRQQQDSFGNDETYFSVEQPHLGLTVTATSRVVVTEPKHKSTAISWSDVATQLCSGRSQMCSVAYEFVFPTARTRPFPALHEYAKRSFADGRSLLDAARELTSRIHKDFHYDPRATNVSTPITEVFSARRGVCQDFAHLQIACFSSIGLAARYVSGYLRTYPPPGEERLIGTDASHAWVSVFCGEAGWVDFDPTNDVSPSTDHVTIAWGRDYNDVCPIRGVILGGGRHQMSVSVDVTPEPGLG